MGLRAPPPQTHTTTTTTKCIKNKLLPNHYSDNLVKPLKLYIITIYLSHLSIIFYGTSLSGNSKIINPPSMHASSLKNWHMVQRFYKKKRDHKLSTNLSTIRYLRKSPQSLSKSIHGPCILTEIPQSFNKLIHILQSCKNIPNHSTNHRATVRGAATPRQSF
jgi:hypothetical protein